MKRIVSVLLAMMFVLAMAGNCFAEGNAEVTGKLTVVHERTDLEYELNELVAQFEKEYPGIDIELEVISDYHKIMNIRFVGGEAPDCCIMGFSTIPKESWPDYLLPLNDLDLQVQGQDTYKIGDNIYGYSQSTSYGCFMYNKQLWDEAGITEMPATLDELIVALEKLAAIDGVIPMTSQYKTTWATRRWIANYVGAFLEGSNWYNWAAETDDPLNNELVVNALSAFRTMYKKGLLDPDLMSSDWDLQASDFAAGTIGTYNAGTYAYATMCALGFPGDDIGFFPYPNPDGSGENICIVTTDYAMVVNKETKYPEAAKIWVDWYTRHFADAVGLVSPLVDEPCNIKGINEVLESDCAFLIEDTINDKALAIKNLSSFDFGTYVQEYLIVEDDELQAVTDKYNALWNAARAEYAAQNAE